MKKTIGIKRNFIIIIISILLSACTKKENASQQALLLELVQAEAVCMNIRIVHWVYCKG